MTGRSSPCARVWLIAAALAAVSTAAVASNLAFWHRLGLESTGATAGLYWISLPYLYAPLDANSNSLVDAQDLIRDFQPLGLESVCSGAECAVAEVRAFDPATGEYVTWTAEGTGTLFELEPGAGYAVVLRTVDTHAAHAVDVVGADDPSLELADCHAPGGVNLRWVSLPPDLDVDVSHGIPDVLDAEDVGQAMGGPEHVFQLRHLNEETGLYEGWVVGSVYGTPFSVDVTRAVGVDLSCDDLGAPCEECPWSWTPPTR